VRDRSSTSAAEYARGRRDVQELRPTHRLLSGCPGTSGETGRRFTGRAGGGKVA
jgi:hypothetical protein